MFCCMFCVRLCLEPNFHKKLVESHETRRNHISFQNQKKEIRSYSFLEGFCRIIFMTLITVFPKILITVMQKNLVFISIMQIKKNKKLFLVIEMHAIFQLCSIEYYMVSFFFLLCVMMI